MGGWLKNLSRSIAHRVSNFLKETGQGIREGKGPLGFLAPMYKKIEGFTTKLLSGTVGVLGRGLRVYN